MRRGVDEMKKIFEEAGIECTEVVVGDKDIRGCIACNYCANAGKCVFDDDVNKLAPLFEEAAGLVWQAQFTMLLQTQPLRHVLTGFFTALTLTRP
mgnify:FL=1